MKAQVKLRQGFTLVEMMVALLIGSVSVIVAAKVAQVVIRQSSKGRQVTDFSARARLIGRQIRTDVRLAGYGSTGAVAVDLASAPWGLMGALTPAPGNFPAIPAVTGANNLAAVAVGGRTTLAGSDAIQVVVPNPATLQRTADISSAPGTLVAIQSPGTFACAAGELIFVVDHSAPTGAGRTQLAFLAGIEPGGARISDPLQFSAGAQSDVMCARLSTYWVDDQRWLHRTDMRGPAPAMVNIGGDVWVDGNAVAAGTDLIAPGALDLQIAYRVSSEIYRLAGIWPPPPGNDAQWVFEGNVGNPDARMAVLSSWFEARMVRFSLLLATLRQVEVHVGGNRPINRLEDAAALPPIALNRALRAEWITSTESVTNLRYFDLSTAGNIPAEPF